MKYNLKNRHFTPNPDNCDDYYSADEVDEFFESFEKELRELCRWRYDVEDVDKRRACFEVVREILGE